MNESHCPSFPWPGFISRVWQSILRSFSLTDFGLPTPSEPVVVVGNDSVSPQWCHITCGYGAGKPKKSTHRQTMAEINRKWQILLNKMRARRRTLLNPMGESLPAETDYPSMKCGSILFLPLCTHLVLERRYAETTRENNSITTTMLK